MLSLQTQHLKQFKIQNDARRLANAALKKFKIKDKGEINNLHCLVTRLQPGNA